MRVLEFGPWLAVAYTAMMDLLLLQSYGRIVGIFLFFDLVVGRFLYGVSCTIMVDLFYGRRSAMVGFRMFVAWA